MMTIKPINIEAEKASFAYYTNDNYYTLSEGILCSEWHGSLRHDLELIGKVQPELFEKVLSGKINGQHLGNVKDGETRHRPGYDLTFSAPKSVSILGEVYGRTDVIAAHEAAVKETLSYFEQHYVVTRAMRDATLHTENTQKALFAIFRHDVSRELDPQTHSHAILLNVTYSDGKYRSIHPDDFMHRAKELGYLYRVTLAEKLKALGYTLRYTNEKSAFFEVSAVKQEALNLFSKRAQQIRDYINKKGAEYSPELAQRVSLITRKAKETLPREALHELWRNELREAGLKEPRVVLKTQEQLRAFDGDLNALIVRGIRRLQATEIAFTEQDLLVTCNHIIAAKKQQVNVFALASTIKAFVAQDKLLLADAPRGKKGEIYYTTKTAKRFEHKIIQRLVASKNVFEKGFMTAEALKNRLARYDGDVKPARYVPLDTGQRQAIVEALSSRDRFHIIQGNAGSGKTTLLSELRTVVMKELGVLVRREAGTLRAFASTHVAVNELQKSLGVDAMTVDRFLVSHKDTAKTADKTVWSEHEIWIVDEASMTDVKKMQTFMDRAEAANARVIFVGDVNQLESVGPGRVLHMMQEAGIAMSRVEKIHRQQNEALRGVAESINAQKHARALDQLNAMGGVVQHERVNDAIVDYLTARTGKDALNHTVVVPTNEDREELNQRIRALLKAKGVIKQKNVSLNTLVSRVIPDVELKHADQYQVGDVLRFNRRFEVDTSRWQRQLIKSGEYFDVLGRTDKEVLIQSRTTQARFKFDLSLLGDQPNGAVFVFEKKSLELSVGDRLRWLDNRNNLGLMRNHVVDVVKVNQESVVLAQGKRRITLKKDLLNHQHFEHQYAVTAHGAQGISADHVLVAAHHWRKNSVNQRSLLVGVTRAKHDVRVFTEDLTKLKNAIGGRFADNSMALKKQEMQQTLHAARTL